MRWDECYTENVFTVMHQCLCPNFYYYVLHGSNRHNSNTVSAVRPFIMVLVYRRLETVYFPNEKGMYHLPTNSNFSLFEHCNSLYIIQVLNIVIVL